MANLTIEVFTVTLPTELWWTAEQGGLDWWINEHLKAAGGERLPGPLHVYNDDCWRCTHTSMCHIRIPARRVI